MKSVTFPDGKTLYTWISVHKSGWWFRRWWCVSVCNHLTRSELPGPTVCLAKFSHKDDAEKYAKEQRKRRGY